MRIIKFCIKMKKIKIALFFFLIFISCSKKKEPCDEYSKPYFRYNSAIKGENISIRKAFDKFIKEEVNITPKNGFITLKIHIDKFGNFCNQENFQIDENYQPTIFNNGELIKKVEAISSNLSGWQNDTETKTFYLIRLKIEDGIIKEVF